MTTDHQAASLPPLLAHVAHATGRVGTLLLLCATVGIAIASLTLLLLRPAYLGWLGMTASDRDVRRAR